jgi:hypothetical protein
MGRIAEYLEHPGEFARSATHSLAQRPKSTISGIVVLGLAVVAFVWLWPELQRYLRIRRM